MLDVRFAGGVVDRCDAFGQHGGHEDVCCARERSLVEEHVDAAELLSPQFARAAGSVVDHLGAELAEAKDVGV